MTVLLAGGDGRERSVTAVGDGRPASVAAGGGSHLRFEGMPDRTDIRRGMLEVSAT